MILFRACFGFQNNPIPDTSNSSTSTTIILPSNPLQQNSPPTCLVVGRPDNKIASTDLFTIELFGLLSILLGHHGHKGKSAAASIVTGNDVDVTNSTLLGKGLSQLLRGGVKVQIAHVELGISGVRWLPVGGNVGCDAGQVMLRGGNELVLVIESEKTVTGLVPGMGADGAFDATVGFAERVVNEKDYTICEFGAVSRFHRNVIGLCLHHPSLYKKRTQLLCFHNHFRSATTG